MRGAALGLVLLACRPIGQAEPAAPSPDACIAAHERDQGLVIRARAFADRAFEQSSGAYVQWRGSRDSPVHVAVSRRAGDVVHAAEFTADTAAAALPRLPSGDYELVVTRDGLRRAAGFAVEDGAVTVVDIVAVHPEPKPAYRRAAGALPSDVLLEYRAGACHGSCPVYRVTVYLDGRVRWQGRRHVRARGVRWARLKPAALASLRGWLACIAPLPSYHHPGVAGLPEIDLRFRGSGGVHEFSLNHYDVPDVMYGHVAGLTRVLGLERWLDR